jgi:hypothetical protein
VQVRLHGPFDAMAYDVDYSGAATEFAKSKAGEKIKDKLSERLGIKKPEAKQEGQSSQGSTSRDQALDKLKGLLGR